MLTRNPEKAVLTILSTCFTLLLAGVALASGDGGHHVDKAAQMKDFGWRVVDFALLVGILFWAIKKANLKGMLADRQAQIEKNLTEARQARESAEAKLKEYTEKLDKANLEVDQLRSTMMQEAEAEKQRIIAEAESSAAKVSAQAAQAAEQELLKARTELRAEAARLAVELAATRLSVAVQQGDHDRMVEDYLGKVGQL